MWNRLQVPGNRGCTTVRCCRRIAARPFFPTIVRRGSPKWRGSSTRRTATRVGRGAQVPRRHPASRREEVTVEVRRRQDAGRRMGERTFNVRDFDLEPPKLLMLRVHPDVDGSGSTFVAEGGGGGADSMHELGMCEGNSRYGFPNGGAPRERRVSAFTVPRGHPARVGRAGDGQGVHGWRPRHRGRRGAWLHLVRRFQSAVTCRSCGADDRDRGSRPWACAGLRRDRPRAQAAATS